MEVSLKPRNFAQAYTWAKEDAKATAEIVQTVVSLIFLIVGSSLVFGIVKTGLALASLAGFVLALAVVITVIIEILSFIASFFSRHIAALFGKIRSVVLTSSAKVAEVVSEDWRVTTGTALAIVAGYVITLKLYDYFNTPKPELDPESIPKQRGGTTTDT
jgi:hypothetical protein